MVRPVKQRDKVYLGMYGGQREISRQSLLEGLHPKTTEAEEKPKYRNLSVSCRNESG
jgi:hypothetical protein